jgi:VWFA-related protein
MKRLVLAGVAVIFLVASGSRGQETEREQVVGGLAFVDQVQVTVVNIDVFVRDRNDRPVTGLKKEDFRLLQDGQVRELSHFAAYDEEVLTAMLSPGAPSGGNESAGGDVAEQTPPGIADIQPVHVVIYVDNENIRPLDRNRVLAQVRHFVAEIMKPNVQVMVISVQRSAEIVTPFTNDPGEVEEGLRSMTRLYGAQVDRDRSRGRLIHDMQAVQNDETSGGLRSDPAAADDLEERIRAYAEEIAMELGYSVNNLREILTTLAGLPGRKILVHVSSGLPAVPARDLITWYGDLYQRTSSLPMLARYNRRQLINSVASNANAQGVTFYTIDVTGLAGDAAASAEYARPLDPITSGIYVRNQQEPLLFLAESTGGRALVDSNDVTGLLEELREDLFTYYSLGYTLSTSGSDTLHRIEVEIPEHPEYKLLYRKTMVEKSIETQVQNQVISGLMLALDHNPMGIDLNTGVERPAMEGRWIVPIEIRIPIESVALLPEVDDYVGQVVLFLANRDKKGRQSDMQRREFEIRMPSADYQTRRNERYVASFDLLFDEGEHDVVVGVLDPVTRQTSFATLRVSVPTTAKR